MSTYCEVVQYLIRTYASDDIIAQAEAELVNFRQPSNMNEETYAAALWEKALRCRPVYSEAKLKGLYIEGVHDAIRLNVRSHWATNSTADSNAIARYAASVATLTKSKGMTPAASSHDKYRGKRSTVLAIDAPSSQTSSVTDADAMSDQAALYNEIMLLQKSHGSEPSDSSSSSASMDSGDNCRICWEFKKHDTTECPFLTGDHYGFVRIWNADFQKFLSATKRGLTRKGRGRGGGVNNRADNLQNQQSNTPSTKQSETAVRTGPPQTNTTKVKNQGQTSGN